MAIIKSEWHGLYREKWGRDRLQPESFAHPAKAAYGLAVRIAEYLLEQGYIQSSTILPVSRSMVEYITCPRNYIHVQIVESQEYKVSGALPVQEKHEQEPRLPNARQEYAPCVETNSPTYQVSTRHTVAKNASTRETAGVSQSYANNVEMDSLLTPLMNGNTVQIPATKRPLLATNINEERNRSTEPTNLVTLELVEPPTGSGEADVVNSTTECSGKKLARNSEMKSGNAKSAGRPTTSKSTIKSPIGIARTTAERTWQYYVLPVTEKLISLLIEQYPKYFPLGKRAWLENRKTVTFAYLVGGDSIILVGDTVLDPFGGIGGFALPLLERGVNVILVELEARFNDMGQGCECTGISKEDWIRFQGRYDKTRYLDGRYWCPRCVMQAQTIPPRKFNPFKFTSDEWMTWNDRGFHQPTLFGSISSATYERNSGRIPFTEPHHYTGNLEAWNEAGYDGRAVMFQGDSRHLCEVLAGAGFAGAVSSPPYASSLNNQRPGNSSIDDSKMKYERGKSTCQQHGQLKDPLCYGSTPGQLASLPEGDAPQVPQAGAVVSSMPFLDNGRGDQRKNGGITDQDFRTDRTGQVSGTFYGLTPGNLGNLPAGDPPARYTNFEGVNHESATESAGNSPDVPFRNERDGDSRKAQSDRHESLSNTQTGWAANQEPERCLDECLPERTGNSVGNLDQLSIVARTNREKGREDTGQEPLELERRQGPERVQEDQKERGLCELRGNEPPSHSSLESRPLRQSGGESTGIVQELSCTSPCRDAKQSAQGGEANTEVKWPGRMDKVGDPQRRGDRNMTAEYGATEGQLGAMREGVAVQVQASVSSPPFEASVNTMSEKAVKRYDGWAKNPDGSNRVARSLIGNGYGQADGQLGTESGTTFWAASAEIMRQVYQVLAPGAVAVWVCKAFVRKGERVDFPGQWQALGESCGFETLEIIRAWLVEDNGAQHTLDGGLDIRQVQRKSFFRLLAEQKGSPKIDYEIVLIQRKVKE